MAVEWLYRHGNRVHGPVSFKDLQAAVLLGFVKPEDLATRHERHCWKRLMDHEELKGICEAALRSPRAVDPRPPFPNSK